MDIGGREWKCLPWTCNKDLHGPLRRRHLKWVHKIMFEDLLRVWSLLQDCQM